MKYTSHTFIHSHHNYLWAGHRGGPAAVLSKQIENDAAAVRERFWRGMLTVEVQLADCAAFITINKIKQWVRRKKASTDMVTKA